VTAPPAASGRAAPGGADKRHGSIAHLGVRRLAFAVSGRARTHTRVARVVVLRKRGREDSPVARVGPKAGRCPSRRANREAARRGAAVAIARAPAPWRLAVPPEARCDAPLPGTARRGPGRTATATAARAFAPEGQRRTGRAVRTAREARAGARAANAARLHVPHRMAAWPNRSLGAVGLPKRDPRRPTPARARASHRGARNDPVRPAAFGPGRVVGVAERAHSDSDAGGSRGSVTPRTAARSRG
jgi:hypothetical protein